MKRLALAASAAAVLLLSSCMTLQHVTPLPAEDTEDAAFSSEMEARLAAVDAESLQGQSADGIQSACRFIIDRIEQKLSLTQPDKGAAARLTALQGRAFLLAGNKAQARSCYERAKKKNGDDVMVIILGRRLGTVTDLDEAVPRHEGDGRLLLEKAITLYQSGRYADAAGYFDTAFLSLPLFYRQAYKPLRDTAWSLKNAVSGDAAFTKLLRQDTLSLVQMLEIAEHTTDLLNVYTGGEILTGRKLYTAAEQSGLLDSVSGTGDSVPAVSRVLSADTTVTRLLCARFLWNLKNSGSGNAAASVKYSQRYRKKIPAVSPVPDVPLDSEDFDAVIGTVENELLVLPDGRNFNPGGTVSGVEFNESVKKLR